MSNSITRDESGQYTLNGVFSPDELLEIAEAVLRQRMERVGQPLEDPAQANRFLRMAIGGLPYEVFAVLLLDGRHRILGFEKLFRGSIANVEVHPREVARLCLKYDAVSIIACHNHPSGESSPSTTDRVITQRLKEALALIDVRLLDHIVVGATETTSMALRGWV